MYQAGQRFLETADGAKAKAAGYKAACAETILQRNKSIE